MVKAMFIWCCRQYWGIHSVVYYVIIECFTVSQKEFPESPGISCDCFLIFLPDLLRPSVNFYKHTCRRLLFNDLEVVYLIIIQIQKGLKQIFTCLLRGSLCDLLVISFCKL